jgi:hypothetical protein
MANPVLKGQVYKQTAVEFGAALVLPFEQVLLNGTPSGATLNVNQSRALPCNAKVLAVAVEFENTTTPGTTVPAGTVGLNISSGIPTGGNVALIQATLTITGTATGNGTNTLTIVGPTPATSQVSSAAVTPGQTPGTMGANLTAAINATPNSQVYATAVAGVITLTQLTPQNLLTQLGGQQTYQGTTTAASVAIAPSTPTLFATNPNSMQIGTPDNFMTSTPSSVFAAQGQFVFGKFRTLAVPNAMSPNIVNYAGITSSGLPGQNPFSIAEFDIILPCTRGISLWLPNLSGMNNTTANASALVMPVILDPNQPYPVAGMWVPNNTNLGAPSTA